MAQSDLNIFYADDDPDDRELFVEAAEEISATLKVSTRKDGDELIALLKSSATDPSIVFLDLNMPVRNGYDVLKEIRDSGELKGIYVVILTTSNNQSAINMTRNLGANLYISKPSSFNALKNAIEYSISLDWTNFDSSGGNFVYRPN